MSFDNLDTQDAYSTLQEWYLARLRAEAISTSRCGFTPLAMIQADRRLAEEFILSRALPAHEMPSVRLRRVIVVVWFSIIAVVSLALTFSGANLLDLLCRIPTLLFFALDGTKLNLHEAVFLLCFVAVPSMLAMSPVNLMFASSKTMGATRDTAESLFLGGISLLSVVVFAMLLWLQLHASGLNLQVLIGLQGWAALSLAAFSVFWSYKQFSNDIRTHHLAELTAPLMEKLNLEGQADLPASIAQALHAVTSREKLIADFANDLLMVLSSDLIIGACNNASFQCLNYAPHELRGKKLATLAMNLSSDDWNERRHQGQIVEELRCVSKTGEIVDLYFVFEWSERQQLYFVMARNISKEKQIERARSEFLSMISHDVRSPLVSVLLGVNAAYSGLYGAVGETMKGTLLRCERNIKRIVDLMNETIDLELSSVSVTNVVLQLEDCSFDEIVGEAIEQTHDFAQDLGVNVVADIQSVSWAVDRKRILRVVVNMLTNALKYSPLGSTVTISSSVVGGRIRVNFIDNGPGIPQHLCLAVFNRYYRVGEGRGGVPGTGLGLAICKTFVEAHGGIIGVDSVAGVGSTFWFVLPRHVRSVDTQGLR